KALACHNEGNPFGKELPDMVGGHQVNSLRFENPPTVQRTPVEQHQLELQIVVDRAEQAATAEKIGKRTVAEQRVFSLPAPRPECLAIERNNPVLLVLGHVEVRVVHAERLEQPLLQELVRRLS